jgi:hypothetical protein
MITSRKRSKKKIFLLSLIILVIIFIGLGIYKSFTHKSYNAKEKNRQEQACAKCPKVSDVNITQITPETPIYFTLSDPNEKDTTGMGGMHSNGFDYKNEMSKAPSKKIWLVFEKNKSISSSDLKTFVFDTKQTQKSIKIDDKDGITTYSFEMPKSGYYNILAENETIKDDILFYRVAKLEYLNGKHGGKDVYDDSIKKELQTDKVKIDLIRLKDKKENSFFYNISMGDTLKFKAKLDGKPLKNADITINLNSGWNKNIKTDENGTASFVMIRDYFPSWDDFNKRYKQDLVLTLTFSEEKNGRLENKKYKKVNYILTYPLSYYPNGSDYLSYGFGLIIGIFIFTLSGIIVYTYRRNRTKPFKEIKYEE